MRCVSRVLNADFPEMRCVSRVFNVNFPEIRIVYNNPGRFECFRSRNCDEFLLYQVVEKEGYSSKLTKSVRSLQTGSSVSRECRIFPKCVSRVLNANFPEIRMNESVQQSGTF